MSDTNMKGKVVVVTGAAGGIGGAVAKHFHLAGATLIAIDHYKAKENLKTFLLHEIGLSAEKVGLLNDVSDTADVAGVLDSIMSAHNRIDVLVNAAGILRSYGVLAKTKKADLAALRKVMDVNFWGTVHWCHAVLPRMRAQGYGRIINMSSIMAECADPGNAIYAASKAAVSSFTKTLAHEVQFNKEGDPFDITVNAVAPGIIETSMTKDIPEQYMKQYYARVPSYRKGTPEEIADAVHFLAGNTYMNGVILPVDGGYTAK